MRYLNLVIAVLLLSPMVALADRPTSRPSREERGEGPGGHSGEHVRRLMETLPREAPTDPEWNEATAFFQKHSPNRSEMLKSLPGEGMARKRIQRFIYARYKGLQAMKQDDPDIYQIRLQSIEAEDAVFAALRQYRGPGDSRAKDKAQAELRQQVSRLVNIWLQERQLRIQRLERALAREKEQLGSDRNNLESLIDRRLNKIINEGVGMGLHQLGESGPRGPREGEKGRPQP